MAKITIIGTSHISPRSVKQARDIILKQKPDCVAVELDAQRFHALLQKKRHAPSITSPMYFVLFHIQHYFGKKTGILPGSEMLSAIRAGREVNSKIALIDKNIETITMEMSKISVSEKINIVLKLLGGVFLSPFSTVKKYKFNLRDVPAKRVIRDAMKYMKHELPTFYKILVLDRNKHMAKCIKSLSKRYKKIVVVVGAGHKEGLKRLLK